MPYSASMWDSFESVYISARNDEDCDAYVVPIPWYEYNRKGEITNSHYEGDKFPVNIPITRYDEYDLNVKRPDIIFTHNFYDDYNRVTKVDARFYTGKLRKYTDFLAGIYYGLQFWMPKDPEKIDISVEASYHLPSMANFDRVITYSNVDNDRFVRAWHYLLKDHNESKRQIFTEKFVAWGSPKFDAILNLKNKHFDIPQDWQTKLYDTGGKKKTTILFCTSLAPFLKHGRNYFKKLQVIFDFFRNRTDLLCLWRPHPLMLSTVCSERAILKDEYTRLINDFNKNNGIYDDTSDLHRAIYLGDAYYGDESSLIYMYLALGKPFGIIKYYSADWTPLLTTEDNTFDKVLNWQIDNMKKADGANIFNHNCCIWWDNFFDNNHPIEFLNCFAHYVSNQDKYPQTTEYRALKKAIFEKNVVNSDGTAGQKIYENCKNEILKRRMA